MGGDDLDDDAYLIQPTTTTKGAADFDGEDGHDDEDNNEDEQKNASASVSKKRSRKEQQTPADDDADDPTMTTAAKKKKTKRSSPEQVLLQGAKTISSSSSSRASIASYLQTYLNHHRKLLQSSSSSSSSTPLTSTSEELDVEALLEDDQHLWMPPVVSSQETTSSDNLPMMEALVQSIGKKRLKHWKHVRSPAIIVVCLSARRAVAWLKEHNNTAQLKLRAAKLFPKNGSVQQQGEQLASAAFPLAVGTPHRLLDLLQANHLSWQETHCVVIDTFCSNKDFTVLTLPDTASDCARLLLDHVLPRWTNEKNKTKKKQKKTPLQLAFV